MEREEDELVRHEDGSPDEGDENPDASLCQDGRACKFVRSKHMQKSATNQERDCIAVHASSV